MRRVVLRGETVFVDGQVLAEPGTGHDVTNFRRPLPQSPPKISQPISVSMPQSTPTSIQSSPLSSGPTSPKVGRVTKIHIDTKPLEIKSNV